MININTEIFLRSVKDLNKLKLLVEVNNLDRPNFSAIARELGVDRRTVTIVNILGNSYRTATALSKISDKNN
jgi:hypothetical protein